MGMRTFPVVTDIPANSEWITHGENGYLFPPGDAQQLANFVLKAFENNTMREKALQLNSGLIKEKALDQNIIDKLISVYLRLM
jgi:glycosyltransferase involved in cell wall biosynthesis